MICMCVCVCVGGGGGGGSSGVRIVHNFTEIKNAYAKYQNLFRAVKKDGLIVRVVFAVQTTHIMKFILYVYQRCS